MDGWLSFFWGFLIVFVGGLIIYYKVRFDIEVMFDDDEEWD